jgi:hypothetical protein
MPQLSSTNRLIMASKDMTDALQNPHPEVPFTSVWDDTISALADLAAIFKLKLRQTPFTAPQAVPPQVLQHPNLAASTNKIVNSPMPITREADHRRQFTPKTSPMCHYLRGWSHLGHYAHHLRGCPSAPRASRPATCLRTTSAAWTPPTWQSPSDTTIGHSSTKQTQSSTKDLETNGDAFSKEF